MNNNWKQSLNSVMRLITFLHKNNFNFFSLGIHF